MKKAIILLSGGLDSLVALGIPHENYKIDMALTFDYGQKAAKNEISASKAICEYYKINHKIIKLDWLRDITTTSLVSEKKVPEKDLGSAKSAELVWVPNRNGLFLNIAACFTDSLGYDYILYGANNDEGETFPDNTERFRAEISNVFQTSTLKKPKVLAPLINYTKNDIVRIAIERNMPLNLVRSCYNYGDKHCGKCESCLHLKNALITNQGEKYLKILF